MSRPVNGKVDLRAARRADTELRIIQAATRLFVAGGYSTTTLTAVAREAGVADRTVYVRFRTKAELLKRVVDVAIVGDTLPVDVAGREWSIRALTAPTLTERLLASTTGGRQIMERAGAVLAVAQQAEATEPLIAAAAQAGRESTAAAVRAFWEHLRDDDLLDPSVDLEWVIATCVLLTAADTYLLMTRTLGWDLDAYQEWLYSTALRFATTPSTRA